MKTVDLDRVQFVTRHFNELQGLRFLVLPGLLFLALAASVGLNTLPAQILPVAVLLGIVLLRGRLKSYYQGRFGVVESPRLSPMPVEALSLAGSGMTVAGLPKTTPGAWRILLFAGVAFVPFVILWFLSPAVFIDSPTDWSRLSSQTVMIGGAPILKLDPSALLLVMYFFCGALFLGTWLRRGRCSSQGYHLVIGLLLLGFAALGASQGYVLQALFDGGIGRIAQVFVPALGSAPLALALCGGGFVVAGLLDHWQLVRVLGSPAEEA